MEELHAQIEAQKLTFADLHRYLADPRVSKVPVEGLIAPAYGRERAKLIDANRARCEETPGAPDTFAGNTVYLSVVDREGNIASLIQSVYQHFGSGVVVDDYGFALQNRGALFELDPAHPNALAPRKRPYQTIIPAFMEKGDVHIGFGIMGGMNQTPAHAQFVSNVVDHGMSIQMALEAPRFTKLKFSRLRHPDREPRGEGGPRRADGEGPRDQSGGRFFQSDGRRAGGDLQLGDGREVRSVGSAQGWLGGAGAASLFQKLMGAIKTERGKP